ncbi:MAG: hypothetical protein JWP74_3477 [Marmoricola sp.]|nr:hypothetical protein [Marmoricola sp.]
MTTIHLHESSDPESVARILFISGTVSVGDEYEHDGAVYKATKPIFALNNRTGVSDVVNWEYVPI